MEESLIKITLYHIKISSCQSIGHHNIQFPKTWVYQKNYLPTQSKEVRLQATKVTYDRNKWVVGQLQ